MTESLHRHTCNKTHETPARIDGQFYISLLYTLKHQSGAGCDGRLGNFTYHLKVGSFKIIAGLTIICEAGWGKWARCGVVEPITYLVNNL